MTNRRADAAAKLLFSAREVVRDLVLGFVPDPWVRGLDLSTLERMPDGFVSSRLRRRSSDLVWRVRAGGDWAYLYLMVEFQGRSDRWMALRLMAYVSLFWQDLLRRDRDVRRGGRLPPVLPIVFYSGDAAWHASTDVADLIAPMPGDADRFRPSLTYLLIDRNRYTDAELAPMGNLVAAVMRLERSEDPEVLADAMAGLSHVARPLLEGNAELAAVLRDWLRGLFEDRPAIAEAADTGSGGRTDWGDAAMGLRERFDLWEQQWFRDGQKAGRVEGEAQGREAGRHEGEMLILQRQLTRRFGPLPADITSLISAASIQQLEGWADRVLDATSLDQVFRR